MSIKKRRCDKTVKTSVVEAGKRTNRASIDSEVFELPLASRRSSFVLERDYANIAKRLRFTSQPFSFFYSLLTEVTFFFFKFAFNCS